MAAIDIAELRGDPAAFADFIAKSTDAELVRALMRFGRLAADAPCREALLDLLDHPGAEVRRLAMQLLGQIADLAMLDRLAAQLAKETISENRKEAAHAVSRIRREEALPVVFRLARDADPLVVVQGFLGLLPFRGRPGVDAELEALQAHSNEIVRRMAADEAAGDPAAGDWGGSHPESPPFLHDAVAEGDCRDIMGRMPAGSVHLTFTSPPYYNARDYSIYPSYEAYLAFLREVFTAVRRITKAGRFLVVNTSPVIMPRAARQYSSYRYPIPFDIHAMMADIGWDFTDEIVWRKPEASVKNRAYGFARYRKPLTYKPNAVSEYLFVYRKRCARLIDWNIKQYPADVMEASLAVGEVQTTNVWDIAPATDREHSAVFPAALCENVIRYYSFKGDLVFDPFGGSGTLAVAAGGLGRKFFLAERNPAYVKRMLQRIGPGARLTAAADLPAAD